MLRTADRGMLRTLNYFPTLPGHSGPASAAAVHSSSRWLYNTSDCHGDFGIATGAELGGVGVAEGKSRFDLTPPCGPFCTKEDPMIVESHYDARIVGCSGGVGEDEHDVTWFRLEKGKSVERTARSHFFQVEQRRLDRIFTTELIDEDGKRIEHPRMFL